MCKTSRLTRWGPGRETGSLCLLPHSPASWPANTPQALHRRGTRQKDRPHQPLRAVFCEGDPETRPLHLILTGFSVGNVVPGSAVAKSKPSEDNLTVCYTLVYTGDEKGGVPDNAWAAIMFGHFFWKKLWVPAPAPCELVYGTYPSPWHLRGEDRRAKVKVILSCVASWGPA